MNAIEFTRASIRDAEQNAAMLGGHATEALRRISVIYPDGFVAVNTAQLIRAMQDAASAYSFAESAEDMRAELDELIAEENGEESDGACPECARANGPHYTGECEHGEVRS